MKECVDEKNCRAFGSSFSSSDMARRHLRACKRAAAYYKALKSGVEPSDPPEEDVHRLRTEVLIEGWGEEAPSEGTLLRTSASYSKGSAQPLFATFQVNARTP